MKTKREKSALNYLKIEKKTDIRKRRKSANDYLTYTSLMKGLQVKVKCDIVLQVQVR